MKTELQIDLKDNEVLNKNESKIKEKYYFMSEKYITFTKIKNTFDIIERKMDIFSKIENQNLLLIGSGNTSIKVFLFYYVLTLIEAGQKVILFFDEDNSYAAYENVYSHFESYFKINYPNKKIQITDEKDSLLKGEVLECNADFNILKIKEGNFNTDNIYKRRKYFPDFLKNLSKYENCVLVLDGVVCRNIKRDNLSVIEDLNKNNINVVICDHDPLYYKSIYHLFDNLITSHIYDKFAFDGHPINKKPYIKYEFNKIYLEINNNKKLSEYISFTEDFKLNNTKEFIYFPFVLYKTSTDCYINNVCAKFKPIKT